MKKIIFFIVTLAAICVSCKKDPEPFVISAEMEQLGQEYDGKNFLLNEHYLVFEPDDEVLLWKDATNYALAHSSSEGRTVQLWGSEARNGGNYSYGDNNETYNFTEGTLYGVYPSSAMMSGTNEHPINNVITDNLSATPTINYPSSWNYREEDPARGIYSFGKEAFPMVAYRSGNGPLGFHSVSGIARIQLFSEDNSGTISSITFKSNDDKKKLSGEFVVNDITQEAPYITGGSENSITVNNIGKTIGTGEDGMLTIYLPLPAQVQHNQGAAAVRGITQYDITMTVTSTSKGTFTREFKVDIRRNCITMVPAINVNGWSGSPELDARLVGHGTKDRPFQIYTFDELKMLRDAYKPQRIDGAKDITRGTINGQPITKNTYIKIVRTDIVLDNEDKQDYGSVSSRATGGLWDRGIEHFIGHLSCASNHPTLHGIMNVSKTPLFESIDQDGVVDSVTVRGGFNDADYTKVAGFSPICNLNEGVMNNCVNKCNISYNGSFAGVCVTNRGTLNGCRNEGTLTDLTTVNSITRVAGVCLDNEGGIVQNCVAVSNAKLSTKNSAGGIVHTNKTGSKQGLVRNCYANMNNTSGKSNLGCIVAINESGNTIQSCYVSGSYTGATTYEVGGICDVNAGYIVGCRNEMLMLRGSHCVGGIAARMSGGEIRNCYLDGSGTITTNTDTVNAGGFVGYMSGGSIENCYNVFNCHLGHSYQGSTVGGAVGKIGAKSSVLIWNCYASFNVGFYGSYSIKENGATIKFLQCYSPKGVAPIVSANNNRKEGEAIVENIYKIMKDQNANDKIKEVFKKEKRNAKTEYEEYLSDTPFFTTLNMNREETSSSARYQTWKDGNHPVFL